MKRIIAIVASALAFVGATGAAAASGYIDPQYSQVLSDPSDPLVNNAYALRAESRGEYRKALAAYERVLLRHPDNAEAIEGLVRVRRRLQPAFTNFFIVLGGTYQSNPRQFPSPFETDDGSGYAAFGIVDERRLWEQRWRSTFDARGELFGDLDVLNHFDLEASTGPLFDLTPRIAVRPALIGGYSWLDGGSFFGEVGGSVTFEGYLEGALQSVEVRATWRDYASRWVSDDGFVIDVRGHFAKNGLIGDGDALVFKPRLRWSGVDTAPGVFLPTGFEVGRYVELGGKLEYYYPFTDWLLAGPNAAPFPTLVRRPGRAWRLGS